MALKVWLPLNGTLENKGISNFNLINENATVNTSGKIGSCYAFSGSNQYMYGTYNFYNSTYSVCTWIYTTSNSATQGIICDRTAVGNGFSIFLIGGVIRIDIGGNAIQWTTTYTYPINTWFHLTVTYDGTKASYYINGEYKASYTGAIGSTYWGNTTSFGATHINGSGYDNYLNGRLNDIRIYDHCLSAAEVHEISQGLVVHYKLDEDYIQNKLSYNGWDMDVTIPSGFGTWGPSGHSGSYNDTSDTNYIYFPQRKIAYWIQEDSGTNSYYNYYQYYTFSGGYRSFQTIIKEENSTPITETICIPIWGANVTGDGHAEVSKWTNIFSLGNGFYLCQVDGLYQSDNNPYIGIQLNSGYKIFISEFFLEDGQYCTDIRDALKIQDSSGFGNHGIHTGVPDLSQITTKRYNKCLKIHDYSSIGIGNLTTIVPDSTFTFNMWFYKQTGQWSIRSYETIFGGPGGFELELKIGSEQTPIILPYSWCGSSANDGFSYTLDEWHMLTMVNTSSGTKFYLDGQLKKEGSAKAIPSGKYFIGSWRTGKTQNAAAYVNDARIYCTALSSEDILQLYNTSAKIDNKNQFHSFEVIETSNTYKLNKKGQLIMNQLSEDTNPVKITKNSGSTATQFIER